MVNTDDPKLKEQAARRSLFFIQVAVFTMIAGLIAEIVGCYLFIMCFARQASPYEADLVLLVAAFLIALSAFFRHWSKIKAEKAGWE